MPPIPALFAQIDDAKFDRAFWHSLTAAQALRYDYKAFGIFFGTFGLSSVLFSFSVLMKEDFLEEMHQRSSKVAVYGIMTFMRCDRGVMRRELALVSSNSTRTSRSNDFLLAWDATPLELHVLDVPGAHCLTVFTQGNVAASRKQVAHALIFLSDGLFSPIAPRRHVDASAPRTDVDAHISLWYVGYDRLGQLRRLGRYEGRQRSTWPAHSLGPCSPYVH